MRNHCFGTRPRDAVVAVQPAGADAASAAAPGVRGAGVVRRAGRRGARLRSSLLAAVCASLPLVAACDDHATDAAVSGTRVGAPSAASANRVLLSSHDFNDGTYGGLGTWIAARPNAGIQIQADPTGSGRGNVVRVDYARNSLVDSPDHNGGMYAHPKLPDGTDPSWGDRVYWEGEVYLPQYPFGAPAQPQFDQRKLVYIKYGDTNAGTHSSMVLVLWGRTDGSGMDLALSSGRHENGGYELKYHVAPFAWNSWHKVGLEYQANTRGNADGWVKVFVNDSLVYQRTNVLLFSTQSDPATEYLQEFGIGNQEQWGDNVLFHDYRLWDNVRFYTSSDATPASVLLSSHDFNAGTYGGLGTWIAARPNAGIQIQADPTGSGRGSVVRIDYARNTLVDSPDHNGGMYAHPKLPDGTDPSWGDRVYWEGEVYLPQYPFGAPVQPQFDQRKLAYVKYGDTEAGTPSSIVLNSWGRSDGSGMDLSLSSGRHENGGYEVRYGIAPLAWNTWHKVALEYQANTRGNADGWVKVYFNDALVYQRTNVLLFSAQSDPATEFLREFGVGNQEQWGDNVLFRDYRLWDNLRFYTAKP